jgi:hypothetical protein
MPKSTPRSQETGKPAGRLTAGMERDLPDDDVVPETSEQHGGG